MFGHRTETMISLTDMSIKNSWNTFQAEFNSDTRTHKSKVEFYLFKIVEYLFLQCLQRVYDDVIEHDESTSGHWISCIIAREKKHNEIQCTPFAPHLLFAVYEFSLFISSVFTQHSYRIRIGLCILGIIIEKYIKTDTQLNRIDSQLALNCKWDFMAFQPVRNPNVIDSDMLSISAPNTEYINSPSIDSIG